MNRIQISYDRKTMLWSLRNADGPGKVDALELVVDCPCTLLADGQIYVPHGVIVTDNVRSLQGSHDALCDRVRVQRTADRPRGLVNHESMLDWAIQYEEPEHSWLITRQDGGVRVRARDVRDADCLIASTESSGVLACRAEMLVDGRTNRDRSYDDVRDLRDVKLRTLIVHDQVVEVQPMSAGQGVIRPG